MEQTLLVITNMPDAQSARTLSRRLVELRLAACVNVLPGVQSVYRWSDGIEEANEIMLVIKTVRSRYGEVEAAIKLAHPYQVPEIIALPIADGSPDYLNWITRETKKDGND